ncbi:MAG: amidohydrolase family protein [Solirubrobacteraceae bacterium]
MLIDVHQHLWTEPFVAALATRDEFPFVRHADGDVVLHLAGERPYLIDTQSEAATHRAALVESDGLDRALIAISSPLGVEALPRGEALDLIEAYVDGVSALPGVFSAWGPLALELPDPADVVRLLDCGFVGVSLPAGALAEPRDARALVGVLEELERRGAPLFVHPGPGLGPAAAPARDASPLDEPRWWPALTRYVFQMHAAWLAFVTVLAPELPDLRVVFAMLAGGAPLLSERLESRGGPRIDLRDKRLWYESSSYGPAAVEAMARRVGRAQLLYGSDRPVVDVPTPSGDDARLRANGAWLLE